MRLKTSDFDLLEVAEALSRLDFSASIEVMESCIERGYQHLVILKASQTCNVQQVVALEYRIDRVRYLLQEKQRRQRRERSA